MIERNCISKEEAKQKFPENENHQPLEKFTIVDSFKLSREAKLLENIKRSKNLQDK